MLCFILYIYIVLLIILYHIEGFLNNWIHFDFRIKIKILYINIIIEKLV